MAQMSPSNFKRLASIFTAIAVNSGGKFTVNLPPKFTAIAVNSGSKFTLNLPPKFAAIAAKMKLLLFICC